MSTKTETKPEAKCDVKQVKAGDVWSRHSFGRVVDVDRHAGFQRAIQVQNLDGKAWDIGEDLVAAEFSFANQSNVDVTLSRTKVLEILTKRTWTAMTVKFRKKVDLKEAAAKLMADHVEPNSGRFLPEGKEVPKMLETLMAGEERTMIGYHHGDLDPHGRLIFAEIVDGKEQRRLIDPRTVFEVIVAQTRYVVDE